MPVVADATSAVFYPGKLVMGLPLTFASRYAWYIVLHVLLATAGAYRLARGVGWRGLSGPEHGLSRPAAGLCAMAYALSGPVLFQYCNVVFLVGAAWLPWALWAAYRMLIQRSVRWSLALGVCLALMVLGGDPQSAYHAGLLAALCAGLGVWAGRPRASAAAAGRQLPRWAVPRELGRALCLLAIAGISGLSLSAVQIVPALSWLATSDRAVFTYPRSIYEIPSYLHREEPMADQSGRPADPGGWSGVARGLWGRWHEPEHAQHTYGFSVAPWRLLELLWPNVSGRTFPENHRWLAAIGGEDRVWTPSLYLGLLPLVLALGAWRVRRADVRVQWWSWAGLLAVLGSFGWYGVGLMVRSLHGAIVGDDPPVTVAEPVGGLYWFMVVCLPGYAHFRYPAKLMVIASLALAMLGGIGLDQLLDGNRDRGARALRNVGIASLLGAVLVLATRRWWITGLADASPDELFGPLDAGAAWLDALTGCVHAACVSGVLWWLVRSRHLAPGLLAPLLLLVTACDLAWAQGWMILTAPASAMGEETVMDIAPGVSSPATVYRWPSRLWVPRAWRETTSAARAEESVRWDVATLYARLHLLGPHRSLRSQSSMAPFDLRALLGTRSRGLPHPAVLDLLGAEYLIAPDDCPPPGPGWTELPALRQLPGVNLWRNAQPLPRAWIVHEVESRPPWTSTDPRAIRAYYDALLFPDGRLRDFRTTAVVESDQSAARAPKPAGLSHPVDPVAAETVHVQCSGTTRLDLSVTLATPGLLVVNQYYDPRWQVDICSPEGSRAHGRVVRTNRVMQGVFLPAGTHELEFRYVPRDLYWAGGVSLAGWLLVLLGMCIRARRSVGLERPGLDGSR